MIAQTYKLCYYNEETEETTLKGEFATEEEAEEYAEKYLPKYALYKIYKEYL